MQLRLDLVSAEIDGREIVSDVDLHVSPGAVVGLVGPNGSGKSTLLRCAYRVLRPTAGLVTLEGDDLWALSAKETARRAGVVVQETPPEFDLSVWEVVILGRAPHQGLFDRDTTEDHRLVDDALARVAMDAFAERTFGSLSGGEKQRVLLARALAQGSQLLILDEPTDHLDIHFQLAILELVRGCGRRGGRARSSWAPMGVVVGTVPTVRSVRNMFDVLEALAEAGRGGVGQLSRATGIPKSTVQRCVQTAAEAGWMRRDGQGDAWTMTPRVLRICAGGVERDLREAARPVMRRLRDATGEAVHLVARDGGSVVLLERLAGSGPVQVVIPIGFRVPIHAGATGKAMLAALDPATLDGQLPGRFDALTTRTVVDRSVFVAELARVRRRGWATNTGEWDVTVAAVAAAVVVGGDPVAAISVSGTPSTIPVSRHAELGTLVVAAAGEIAGSL